MYYIPFFREKQATLLIGSGSASLQPYVDRAAVLLNAAGLLRAVALTSGLCMRPDKHGESSQDLCPERRELIFHHWRPRDEA